MVDCWFFRRVEFVRSLCSKHVKNPKSASSSAMMLLLIFFTLWHISSASTLLCDFYRVSYRNLYELVRCPRNDSEICDCFADPRYVNTDPSVRTNRGFYPTRVWANSASFRNEYVFYCLWLELLSDFFFFLILLVVTIWAKKTFFFSHRRYNFF